MSETLRDRIIRHEGLRIFPYRDTVGKLTIGIGRNLDDKGISKEEAFHMLDNDISFIKSHAGQDFPWILGLDDARKDVIYEMIFQLGTSGVKGFPKMIAAIRDHNYAIAAHEMLNSKWHTQTPSRAEELAAIMLNGA